MNGIVVAELWIWSFLLHSFFFLVETQCPHYLQYNLAANTLVGGLASLKHRWGVGNRGLVTSFDITYITLYPHYHLLSLIIFTLVVSSHIQHGLEWHWLSQFIRFHAASSATTKARFWRMKSAKCPFNYLQLILLLLMLMILAGERDNTAG